MAQNPVLKAVKPKVVKSVVEKEHRCENEAIINSLVEILADLNERVLLLEANTKIEKGPSGRSIHKVEDFAGEVATPVSEYVGLNRMDYNDKIASARNACMILPPNLIVDGRHTAENVGAICGFIVTEEMLEDIYATITHEDYRGDIAVYADRAEI
jgi:hypothetical protein